MLASACSGDWGILLSFDSRRGRAAELLLPIRVAAFDSAGA
jgi:hypothetical protein